jgi:hypothetical protein
MPDWPSFRSWQTTTLPEPYRSRCRAVWAARDLQALVAGVRRLLERIRSAVAAVVAPPVQAVRTLGPVLDEMLAVAGAPAREARP